MAEEIGELNHELRRSLRSIVNVIRGLLTTFDPESSRSTGTPRQSEGNTLGGDVEDTGSTGTEDNAS